MKFLPYQIRSPYWPFWVVILLLLAGCSGLKSENEKLKEEIVDVSAENEKLRKDLNALKSENSKMHMRIAQLHLEIAALHQEIQNMQKDVDTFKAQLRGGEKKKY
jgi:archaellum component FlaC